MDVTICVATFGDREWMELAMQRAVPSAQRQFRFEDRVIYAHRDTLSQARNAALEAVQTEWVIFLDADDELEPGYVAAMAKGSADLRAPAVGYVRGNTMRPPYVPRVAGHTHDCTAECLPQGNWLVIGTCARTEMVRQVGGFMDWPVYEDWCLWWRCVRAGATVEAIPEAVYRAHVRPDSRNRRMPLEERNLWHHRIVGSVTRGVAA